MSAIGTALGPSLGGLLIAGPGWRTIFLVNQPLGLLAFALAWRSLPADRPAAARARFDSVGTLLLALTLAAYALSMTLGHGRFGRHKGRPTQARQRHGAQRSARRKTTVRAGTAMRRQLAEIIVLVSGHGQSP